MQPSKLPGFDVVICSGSTSPSGIITLESCSSSELSAIVRGNSRATLFHLFTPLPLRLSNHRNLSFLSREPNSHLGVPLGNNLFLKKESKRRTTNGDAIITGMMYVFNIPYIVKKYVAIIATTITHEMTIAIRPGRYKSTNCTYLPLNITPILTL